MGTEYRIDDEPFGAHGDGKTNDRAAIQLAVDTAFSAGGGRVILSAGKTYLSGGIILRSNTELHFENGAVLMQCPGKDNYVKPSNGGCEPYEPLAVHNFSDEIKWSHVWFKNYPFVFAPEGTENIAVTGNGTIRMDAVSPDEELIRICPIGFYRVNGVKISDITISGYHSYAMMPNTSSNILIKNVKIGEWSGKNCDGICLMNCRDVRITGCDISSGDDSLYIFSSYRDPRGGEWWSSDEPEPSKNIEIDRNRLVTSRCKAFAMIPWGIDCPDPEKTEISNIYIHDNYIRTMGVWRFNPYAKKTGDPPIKNIRFENNTVDAIEKNFFDTQISGLSGFRSMTALHNGNFRGGASFWLEKSNIGDGFAGVCRTGDGEEPYGFVSCREDGCTALVQGIYIRSCDVHCFTADVCTDGVTCRMTVRNSETGELVKALDFCNTERKKLELLFSVPTPGNYDIGIESGDTRFGMAKIYYAELCGGDGIPGYKRVENVYGGDRIVYFYNDFDYHA